MCLEEAESGRVTADGDRTGPGHQPCQVLLGHLYGLGLLLKGREFE